MLRKGILRKFRGSWGSGVGFLDIEDCESHKVEAVPCENGPTVRGLEAAFGNVISEGHCANGNGYVGQVVYWDYDEWGLILGGFVPELEASEELVESYESQVVA